MISLAILYLKSTLFNSDAFCFFTGDAFDDGAVDADSYASEGVFESLAIEL